MDEIVNALLEEENCNEKTDLGVVFGGQSSEYSVSLHSAASFLRDLNKDRYNLTLIGIDKQGQPWVYYGSIDDLEHDHWKKMPLRRPGFIRGFFL